MLDSRYFGNYFLVSFNVIYLGENNGNLSETKKNVFYSQLSLKIRKFLLDMRKDFLIMSNFISLRFPASQTVLL